MLTTQNECDDRLPSQSEHGGVPGPRWRSPWLACLSTLTIVVVVAAVAVGIREDKPVPALDASVRTPAASPAGSATRSTSPTWLPPSAYADAPAQMRAPSNESTSSAATVSVVHLAGTSNANTIPAAGVDDQQPVGSEHPATIVRIVFVPGILVLPPANTDPAGSSISTVDVAGHAARLLVSDTGYGAVVLDWLDPDGYHLILTQRLRTAQGASGLVNADLLKLASSLYS